MKTTLQKLTWLFDKIFHVQVTLERSYANELMALLASLSSHVDLDNTPTTDPKERGRIWVDVDVLKVSLAG